MTKEEALLSLSIASQFTAATMLLYMTDFGRHSLRHAMRDAAVMVTLLNLPALEPS